MIGRNDQTNYYEILEVRVDAPQGEIYRAYQRAKATYSVDNPALYSMFTPEETRQLLQLIEEAYSVLSNSGLRKSYDDNLAHQQSLVRQNVEQFLSQHSQAPQAQQNNQTQAAENYQMQTQQIQDQTPHQYSQPMKYQTIESTDEYVVRKKESSTPLPEGTAKTSLSTYKLDPKFENEITNSESFDGTFLKRIREYKSISLERMSEATRISRTYLGAVETSDYKNLPAPVFIRGFIVQMARILGLDENKVANSYMQIYKSSTSK